MFVKEAFAYLFLTCFYCLFFIHTYILLLNLFTNSTIQLIENPNTLT